MGQPKALLKWDSSTTFIEKIINEFCSFNCTPVICVINKSIEPDCRRLRVPSRVKFIINEHPESGRFSSVRTGINEITEADFCFIHNVDNPFVNRDVISRLFALRDPDAWCSPVYAGKGGHPVLIPFSVIRMIANTHDLAITLADILNSFSRINMEMPDDTLLRNINTRDDYNKYWG
jgi:CTP:molybdopterin cytidylyltransferase MocA